MEKKELQEEYNTFTKNTTEVESLEDFYLFLKEVGQGFKADKKFLQKELRENSRWRLEAEIRNFFFFLFEEEEVELYEEDDAIVKEGMTWIQILQTYLEKIASIATEENYGELTKLVDFSIVYYEKELAYYDHLRDDLEIMARGYHVLNSKYQDIRGPFLNFLAEKVKEQEQKVPEDEKKEYQKRRFAWKK